jgi:hypothetical protein
MLRPRHLPAVLEALQIVPARCTRTGRPNLVLIQVATARAVQCRSPVGDGPLRAWRSSSCCAAESMGWARQEVVCWRLCMPAGPRVL